MLCVPIIIDFLFDFTMFHLKINQTEIELLKFHSCSHLHTILIGFCPIGQKSQPGNLRQNLPRAEISPYNRSQECFAGKTLQLSLNAGKACWSQLLNGVMKHRHRYGLLNLENMVIIHCLIHLYHVTDYQEWAKQYILEHGKVIP